MKALYFEEHGNLDVIQYGDVPEPEVKKGEVLIRVRASGLNHLDIWVRRGWPGLKLPMPHWCGADVAGEVMALGEGVSNWEVGQRVVVDPGIRTVQDEFTRKGLDSLSPGYCVLGEQVRGGAAECVSVPVENIFPIPAQIDFSSAAAPLLVGLTTWRMLIHQARLKAGETVLVVGAGGGVNSMSIQIAKLAGTFVYVVASNGEKARHAESLGADMVFDRSKVDWGREVQKATSKRGIDVVVDNVGKATINTSIKAVARGGRIVVVGNTSGPNADIDLRYIFGKQIHIIGSSMGSHQDFKDVMRLVTGGQLKPVIDRVMPLSEGKKAYERMEKGEQFGKIILEP